MDTVGDGVHFGGVEHATAHFGVLDRHAVGETAVAEPQLRHGDAVFAEHAPEPPAEDGVHDAVHEFVGEVVVSCGNGCVGGEDHLIAHLLEVFVTISRSSSRVRNPACPSLRWKVLMLS